LCPVPIPFAAGAAALAVGPVAAFAAKRRGLHTRLGTFYYWAFVVIFASAVVLAALNCVAAWWLVFVGAFSYSFALVGYLAAKRRRRGWLLWHVSGQGGS